MSAAGAGRWAEVAKQRSRQVLPPGAARWWCLGFRVGSGWRGAAVRAAVAAAAAGAAVTGAGAGWLRHRVGLCAAALTT